MSVSGWRGTLGAGRTQAERAGFARYQGTSESEAEVAERDPRYLTIWAASTYILPTQFSTLGKITRSCGKCPRQAPRKGLSEEIADSLIL